MRKRINILLLLMVQVLMLVNTWYAINLYFGLGFDAADNLWPFSRYYFNSYPHEIKYMMLTVLILLVFHILKNNLNQKKGRVLIIMGGYLLKLILVLSLISAMSSIHVLNYTNDLNAHLSISFFNILVSMVLSILVLIILIREIIEIFK